MSTGFDEKSSGCSNSSRTAYAQQSHTARQPLRRRGAAPGEGGGESRAQVRQRALRALAAGNLHHKEKQ